MDPFVEVICEEGLMYLLNLVLGILQCAALTQHVCGVRSGS